MYRSNTSDVSLKNSLQALSAGGDASAQLVTLINQLRPRSTSDVHFVEVVTDRFSTLCDVIENDETLRCHLRNQIWQLLVDRKQVSFFADSGILPNSGFFSELWRRVAQRFLPAIKDAASLKDCINHIFYQRDDWVWLAAIPVELKLRFWHVLHVGYEIDADRNNIQQTILDSISQMLDAGDVLAIRIGAMGLEPELVRLSPRIEEHDSPFVALAGEAQQLSAAYRQYLIDGELPAEDERQLIVLIDQCREVILRVRSRAANVGTSLSLTYLLSRLEQSLQRLEMIVRMLMARHQSAADASADVVTLWVEFLQHAIRGESERQSARKHISGTIGLLALRVTENASRTGEHYITSTRAEYFEMWRLAMGGGFIVAFMSLIKLASSQTNLAPLGYFMAYAMNYAFGFMLIHILHLTLATKQPAMTASTIVGAIGEIRGGTRRAENDVEKLATLIVDLIRSQIAAILGNVLIAIPTAIIINLALSKLIGQPLMGAEKAQKLIHELSPFDSLALFHAAIAGVCLFIAGLISGYYDNFAAYERIRERIEHAHWLQSLLGCAQLARFAVYIDNNLGALAGNFSLGVMLALIGTIGFLTGLPIDVRHVTLSSANFGLAFASLDFNLSAATIMKTLLGIGLVGFVNLSVSFVLALWVAMRARDVALSQTSALMGVLLRRFASAPRQFFWPVKTSMSENVKA